MDAQPVNTHAVCKRPANVKELTARAVVASVFIAAIIGAAYPYVVMKIGYGPNTSIVSAIFGYLTLGIFFKDFNRWENNLVQTAGTSAGAMAFLCVIRAAFDMLSADPTLGFNLSAADGGRGGSSASAVGVALAAASSSADTRQATARGFRIAG